MEVEIAGYRNVEYVLLKGNKIVLFGPNGAGKTNILRAVYLAAKALAGASFRISRDDFKPGGYIRLDRYTLKYSEGQLSLYEDVRLIDSTGAEGEVRFNTSGGVKAAFVNQCAVYVGWQKGPIDACGGEPEVSGEFLFEDPYIASRIARRLKTLGVGLWSVYYKYAYRLDKWVEGNRLSYGELRLLAILYAIEAAPEKSIILIDAFETGLHHDWIVKLIELLTEIPQTVMIETHSGLALKAAKERKWSSYYIEGGKSKVIEALSDVAMFAREREAYVAALG
ncbi:AAA family ATPase [Pyrobaculum sp.]|uniref:AAA family ATPase n=1 Tax=Pyrobaculum sp. TaxID=2004705 RepID=UPI003D13DB02